MTDPMEADAVHRSVMRSCNFWAESLWQSITAFSVLMAPQDKIAIPIMEAEGRGLSVYVKDGYLHIVSTGELEDGTTIN